MTGRLPPSRATYMRNPFTRRMLRNTVENRRKLAIRALRESVQGSTPPISENTIRQWLAPNLDRVINPSTNRMVKATSKAISNLNEFISNSLGLPQRISESKNTIRKAIYKRTIHKYINQRETANLSIGVRYENKLNLPCINAKLFDGDGGWARSAHEYRMIFDLFIYPKLLTSISARLQNGPVKVSSSCNYQVVDISNDGNSDDSSLPIHMFEYPYQTDESSWWYNWGESKKCRSMIFRTFRSTCSI